MDIEEETKNEQEESKLEEERRMTDADLENELVLLKKKVEGIEKPPAAFPVRILSPSIKDKNLKMKTFDEQIEKLPEHCKNFSIDLKENFETDDKITNRLGIKLGKCLADIIKEDQSRKTTKEEEPNARVARSLIESLGEPPVHVRFIGSEVSLCGYMYKENEQWRELYFWKGKADAIGWDKKNEKFVIVEWKVKEANESKDVMAFKPFQFQSLVYAKLLKLLLELKYLPSILIVLIDGQSGKKVHAGFFEAPDSLGNEYVWSDRKPELTIEIQPGSLFREGLNEGEVREDMPLSKLFSDNATLEDLQKFFKTPPLKVIPKHNND